MYLNEDGWFVVSPYRYTGETFDAVTEDDVAGPYKIINHLHNISDNVQKSEDIVLHEDHTVTGGYKGNLGVERKRQRAAGTQWRDL